jgi:hypothetical protein
MKQIILRNIELWYNGYTHPDKGVTLKYYNPYSVILYLKDCIDEKKILTPRPHWAQSGV